MFERRINADIDDPAWPIRLVGLWGQETVEGKEGNNQWGHNDIPSGLCLRIILQWMEGGVSILWITYIITNARQ